MAVEMLFEERGMAAVDAQALPYPVAEHEPGVEHRHRRLRPWQQFAVDVDQYVGIAWVVLVIVCAVRAHVPNSSSNSVIATTTSCRLRSITYRSWSKAWYLRR